MLVQEPIYPVTAFRTKEKTIAQVSPPSKHLFQAKFMWETLHTTLEAKAGTSQRQAQWQHHLPRLQSLSKASTSQDASGSRSCTSRHRLATSLQVSKSNGSGTDEVFQRAMSIFMACLEFAWNSASAATPLSPCSPCFGTC